MKLDIKIVLRCPKHRFDFSSSVYSLWDSAKIPKLRSDYSSSVYSLWDSAKIHQNCWEELTMDVFTCMTESHIRRWGKGGGGGVESCFQEMGTGLRKTTFTLYKLWYTFSELKNCKLKLRLT